MASPDVAPEHLTLEQARARVTAAVRALGSERVALFAARGRALAEQVIAPHGLPPFRNASMDGIAVRAADLARASPAAPVALAVAATLAAGQVADRALAPGEAMHIMTGAMLPEGADAVIPIEDLVVAPEGFSAGTELTTRRVFVPRPARPAENIREPGRDVAAGAIVMRAGRELSAYDLALLGSLGLAELSVGKRPRVAILSTGDELLEIGAPLRPGAIRDTNLPMLAALVEETGAIVVSAAREADQPDAVAAAIRAGLAQADVMLTIGGVSAGDFDPVKLSLAALGGIALWRVAMKPGRPQAFGAPDGRLFFGLPGNPASVACVFEVMVRPALRRLQGFHALERPRAFARTSERIESRVGRTDFVRVTLAGDADAWRATPAGDQVSGHLSPQSHAHGLLVIPPDCAALDSGERAEVMLWRWPEPAA